MRANDILDTERLIRFGQEASGKDRKEAIMIGRIPDFPEQCVGKDGL